MDTIERSQDRRECACAEKPPTKELSAKEQANPADKFAFRSMGHSRWTGTKAGPMTA